MRSVSVRRGAATLAVAALLLFPVAAFADAAEIVIPPGAPAASQLPSAAAEIHFPPGLWDVAFNGPTLYFLVRTDFPVLRLLFRSG